VERQVLKIGERRQVLKIGESDHAGRQAPPPP
jgi:hypothetical protein